MDNPARPRRFGTFCALAAIGVAVLVSDDVTAEAVATVNGVDIDSATFDFYLESRTQRPANQVTAAERDAALQELTDIYILTTQPAAEQLEDDPRIKAQVELQFRGVLAQAVAAEYLESHPATDTEILAEYETQIKLAPALQFKARHILVETQGAAVSLIANLNAGESFEELAKTNSTGPSGPSGGDLGWFSPNQMVAPFSEAVAALEDGAYTTEPVQTEFGWHVILREESRASEPPTLDSVRETIKQRIEQNNFQSYLEALRSDTSD